MPSSFRPCLAILAAALLTTSVALAFKRLYPMKLSAKPFSSVSATMIRPPGSWKPTVATFRSLSPGLMFLWSNYSTPYAQAVESSSKQGAGYSAQQAIQDYQVRDDSLRVSVHVRYTSTHGAGFPYSQNRVHWKDFQVRLLLGGKSLKTRSVRYEGTLMGTGYGVAIPTGFIVRQEYDVPDPTSTDATIEVDTPDGQHVVAAFDLSSHR